MSAHLHEWIDLIFGYKQTGEEALKAHNVFHHLFYEGTVDIDKIEDPVKRNATISFIHNFGQMPKQVYKRIVMVMHEMSPTPFVRPGSIIHKTGVDGLILPGNYLAF